MFDQSTWPAHLRDDAPCQQCTSCRRWTWDTKQFGRACRMPQRLGVCSGTFAARPPAANDPMLSELLAMLSAVAIVRPGDRLVFCLGGAPTPAEVDRFHQHVKAIWPDMSVLVVGGQIEMAVVRADEAVSSA